MRCSFDDFKKSTLQSLKISEIRVKIYRIKYFLFVFFVVMILFSLKGKAQGDLLLYPKRIVFEGSKRSQVLNLANSGKDTVRYLISVVQVKMNENGAFENISQPDSGQRFANKFFRFFPRNVVLAPNEAQSIKIQLINSNELETGEYRSHIYFRAEPDKKPLGEEMVGKDSAVISVNLVAVFGISIPVIIRVGESTTQVRLSDVSLDMHDSIPLLKVIFDRTGNMSVYGDISVDHISLQGKITRVGIAKGMALYTPNLSRNINLLLEKKPNVDFHSGKLHILYTTPPDSKSLKIAETELMLN